jgi:small-conductance mechanosensitive channel
MMVLAHVLSLGMVAGQASAATKGNVAAGAPTPSDESAEDDRAPITLDGEFLFHVRGFVALRASERAQGIKQRIAAIAADRSLSVASLRLVEGDDRIRIMAGDRLVMAVLDPDAAAAGVSRQTLAQHLLTKVAAAITAYREDRRPRVLLVNAAIAIVASAILALCLWFFRGMFHRLDALAERRLKFHVERLEARSYQLIQAEQLISGVHGILKFLGVLSMLAVLYIYLSVVFSLFPWTRPLASRLFGIFLEPLYALLLGFLDILPNLAFIAILVLVTRYVLKLTRLYFAGVENGTIKMAKFDRDWAVPTYKIARLVIIAFALVVAYPYIPGSSSEAFKGVSLFIGLMVSLGSSSVISNLMAGYTMIYRRAFKVGDRIMVKDLTGDVTDVRLMVTHLRTIKNEEIVLPNSEILNSHVINYSTLARSHGLILHTTVGIGYETPWRQVEAMLLTAAQRTTGLMKEPAPFVRQQSLGDFAVTYELNAYCDEAQKMAPLYTALHQNILDVFNEHSVQIMTPAYEGDPPVPKVVPKEQWYLPPAKPTDAPDQDDGKPEAR